MVEEQQYGVFIKKEDDGWKADTTLPELTANEAFRLLEALVSHTHHLLQAMKPKVDPKTPPKPEDLPQGEDVEGKGNDNTQPHKQRNTRTHERL